MEAFKNILFNVLIVVGLIAIILTAIWWLLELLNKIFNFSKYIIMYHQYKKKEDLYDLRNKVIVAKDGEISYSCVGDIDEQIVILNKGIEYAMKMRDAEEFRIPIPSALVELPEEDIKFYYEQEGVFVRLHLYMGGVYVCNYRYDPKTQEIENIVFPAGLSKEKRKVARMVLAADRTPYKEALKFHSLMCFATHYRNCIETTEQKEKRISHKHRKILRRSGGATPLITTYRIDSRPVPADGTKRHYTKPTEQVSVRGFYRTTKTGKRVWVRPFTKYNGNSGNNKTYKV